MNKTGFTLQNIIFFIKILGVQGDVTLSTCLMTMVFQFSSGLAFRAHQATASHKFFSRYIRSLSFSRSGLVSWPTKITPTIHKTLLAIKPRPLIYKSMALAGLGLSLATWNKPAIRCEGMLLITRFNAHTEAPTCK